MEIAGYQDLEEIGRGGYAVVYRAHQAQFGRQVAIKVLTNPGFGETDRARFEREALAMGRLSWHPNIVVVHETGTTDQGMPYLVEEFVEGGSLGDRLRREGPLDPAAAVSDLIQLCAAVHTAHEADLLHRDIKPDNALIDHFGRIKLADFGIAAVTGSTLTATGMVTATIAHAAPEVLNGARATFAADVYSLGSTLYELLTGAPAFVRETDESIVPLVVRVTSDPVPDLRGRGVPEPIAAAVEAAMAKDPADRPQTALEYGRLLQSAQQALGLKVTDLAVRADPTPAPLHDDTVIGGIPAVPPAPAAGGRQPAPPAPSPAVRAATPPPIPAPGPGAATTAENPVEAELAAADTGTVAVPLAPAPAPGQTPADPTPPGQTPAPGRGYQASGPTPPEKSARPKAPILLGLLVVVALVGGAFILLSGGDDDPGTEGESFGEAVDTPDTTAGGTTPDPGPGDAVIPVGARPFRIAATEEAVWVTNNEATTVSRIDPATNEVVENIDIGGQVVGIDATDDAVWVANTEADTVVRVDAATGEQSPASVGDQPRIVSVSDTAVWVTNLGSDSVSRIGRESNQVEAEIAVEDDPRGLIADGDDVWVVSYAAGVVTRIDATSNEVASELDVGGNPVSVVVTAGSVWVAESDTDVVIQIDPATNTEVARIPVGIDPTALAAQGDALYVSTAGDDTVTWIDATTGEIQDTIAVGTAPGGVAVTPTDLWVANTEDDTVSRIGLG